MKFTSYYVIVRPSGTAFQDGSFRPDDIPQASTASTRICTPFILRDKCLCVWETDSYSRKAVRKAPFLLPQHAKLNQRKQQKLIAFMKTWNQQDPFPLFETLLEIENFLKLKPSGISSA
jgi:hypothetical protein